MTRAAEGDSGVPEENGLEGGGHGAIPVRQKWKGAMGWIVA